MSQIRNDFRNRFHRKKKTLLPAKNPYPSPLEQISANSNDHQKKKPHPGGFYSFINLSVAYTSCIMKELEFHLSFYSMHL